MAAVVAEPCAGKPAKTDRGRSGTCRSQMVNRYRRIATSVAELNLGELAPLEPAIQSGRSSAYSTGWATNGANPDLIERADVVLSQGTKSCDPNGT